MREHYFVPRTLWLCDHHDVTVQTAPAFVLIPDSPRREAPETLTRAVGVDCGGGETEADV